MLLFLVSAAFRPAEELPIQADGFIAEPFVVELRVWPNPSPNGQFQASFELVDNSQPVRVRVYSLIGRMVYDKELKAQDGRIDIDFSVQDYPRGIYMLEISRGKERITRRLSFL
ncbi:MAG: T9SS type A sorting domain-containing protein [Bacteroidia bacterium]